MSTAKKMSEYMEELREKYACLERATVRLVALYATDAAEDPDELKLRVADLALAAGLSSPQDAVETLRMWGQPVRSSHRGERLPHCEAGRRG